MKHASLIVLIAVAIAGLNTLALPESDLVTHIPDDAYYYLCAARSFAETGSFGSSGFHPAWGIVLTALQAGPRLAVGLGLLLTMIAAWSWWKRADSDGEYVAIAIVASSPAFFYSASGGMEFGLALCAMAFCLQTKKVWLVVVVAVACLARPEVAVAILVGVIASGRPRAIMMSALVGVVVAVAFTVAWNLAISGEVLSTSVRMKWSWAQLYDAEGLARRNVAVTLQHLTGVWAYSAAPWILIGALAALLREHRITLIGAVFLVVALARLEWVQYWHVVALIPFFVAALALLFDGLLRVHRAIGWVVMAYAILNLFSLTQSPPYPAQKLFYMAGDGLKMKGVRYGSWNAGIVSWYSGGRAVNLDGLVNDEVQDYILRGELAGYLKKKDIQYVVDYDSTLLSETYRVRGGYPMGLDVEPIVTIGYTQEFGAYRIWKVK